MSGISMANGVTLIDSKHPEFKEEKGQANGYAPLDAGGKIPEEHLPEGSGGYVLPVATASVLGGVKDGSGVTIAGDGTIAAVYEATEANIKMNGIQAVGTADTAARGDHVHPSDTSKLDASTYTAADVLSKIKTVDGSSSGLDADLLDGKHVTELAAAVHTHAASEIGTLEADLYGDLLQSTIPSDSVIASTVLVGSVVSLDAPCTQLFTKMLGIHFN